MNKIPRFQNPLGNRHDRKQPIPAPKRVSARPGRGSAPVAPEPELAAEIDTWVDEGGAGDDPVT